MSEKKMTWLYVEKKTVPGWRFHLKKKKKSYGMFFLLISLPLYFVVFVLPDQEEIPRKIVHSLVVFD